MRRALAALFACGVVAIAAAEQRPAAPGDAGWIRVFDGTTGGWRGYLQKTLPDGWKVVDGALTRVAKAGDIVSTREFENFELVAEWKIAKGANSGIFYRVVDDNPADTEMWMAAPEYQIIDDRGYPSPLKPTQKTAANYDMHPPRLDATKPAGEWNTTRILVNGNHVEHWLNGSLIVSYDLFSDEWNRLVAESKFKDHPRYARARRGSIGIQDHGDWIAFREIRVRELPASPPPPQPAAVQAASPIPSTHVKTKWAADVQPDHVLPEYPRPQLTRKNWTNLNGTWDYEITGADGGPATSSGKILVPFPIESQLSGVGAWVSPQQRLMYHRTFSMPALASDQRVLLNFGAVDWQADVSVDGKAVGQHRGGYDPFSFDITDALTAGRTSHDLVVAVRDPTDAGEQPRGKQVQRPRSIWYTEVTGIWQTVWLETVPAWHVTGLRIDPDLDGGRVNVSVGSDGRANQGRVTISVLDGTRTVATAAGPTAAITIPSPHRWSPADPFLYGLRVTLDSGDVVESYFGMRSIALCDASGVRRLCLNGQPLFQFGLLDQGWWPDGLYTAPTDEALASDIVKTKELGFNVIRKHVKVEPERWYYHADRLGMLVWQDMPSGDNKTSEGQAEFKRELQAMIDAKRNHPSIVMWVPFNEGWGQHDTETYVAWLKSYDPTRLVNNATGWTDKGVGDLVDIHSYPGPTMPPVEKGRSAALGEFGGLGLPLEGHTWLDKGNWGYRSYTTLDAMNAAYRDLVTQLRLHAGDGLASAIYTQTTDCEIEVNGVMTYDRLVTKLSAESIAANRRLYDPLPKIVHIVQASDRAAQTWRYTTSRPVDGWSGQTFDDTSWREGQSGFGAPDTRFAHVGTAWQTADIWLRTSVTLPATLTAPYLRVFHDDDAEVYVNGEQVAALPGANNGFQFIALTGPARAALHAGANTIAVHAHQIRGGQFIDVGLVDVIDPPR